MFEKIQEHHYITILAEFYQLAVLLGTPGTAGVPSKWIL
jgi:hypothetical protein